jgi:hypothetical protein
LKLLFCCQMADLHLLSLPRELRDLIYAHVLPERMELAVAGRESSFSFFETNGVLLTNHQLRREAEETFWRLLPTTTVVISAWARMHFLVSPKYAQLRRLTQYLVVQTEHTKCSTRTFEFEDVPDPNTKSCLENLVQSMPALRQLTCEVRWQPNNTPSLLLPHDKNDMLHAIRRVTIGNRSMTGWDVECYIVDATRWNKEWSGVVVIKRKPIIKCDDSSECSPSLAIL